MQAAGDQFLARAPLALISTGESVGASLLSSLRSSRTGRLSPSNSGSALNGDGEPCTGGGPAVNALSSEACSRPASKGSV